MTAPVRSRNAIAVRKIDLSQPLRALTDVSEYRSVRLFVMIDDCPIGSVDIVNHHQPISETRLRDEIGQTFTWELARQILARDLTADEDGAGPAPQRLSADISVSIVLATYDRPDDLRKCLRSLLAQQSPRRIEIVVIDNHPSSGLTPPVVAEFPGVVLVNEERQGLAYARNAGFIAGTGDIHIATDDDVVAPPDWVEKVVAPFARPDVMIVTGNTLPIELETDAQRFFEQYGDGGLGRGFQRRVFDHAWFTYLKKAVPTWSIGATANAAFRATMFTHPQIGLMDESLGPGMPSGAGEDTYLFYKVLKAGYTIVYEPSAYVWHKHRQDMAGLRRQLYNYSKGHIGYHLTTLINDRDLRSLVRIGYELPRYYMSCLRQGLRWRSGYPLSLAWLELRGNLAGPWGLWQSWRRVWREGRSGRYIPVAERPIRLEHSARIELGDSQKVTFEL